MSRIVIVGGPRTGKTTLARQLTASPRHTDDAMHLGWSESSAHVATWFNEPGPWVVEGVATARALRKWLAEHEHGRPCDVVKLVNGPKVGRTSGQETMAKGVNTVWLEIAHELTLRGVHVEVA